MKRFVRLPGARICGAFLAGMLLVAAAVLVFNLYGPPHQSWAEDNGLSALAAAPLPGLGADTIPDIVANVSPAVVRIDTTVQRNARSYNPLFDAPFSGNFSATSCVFPLNRKCGGGWVPGSSCPPTGTS